MVDLLEQKYRNGRRFKPTEFIEDGSCVAVGMAVSDPRWHGEVLQDVFKVFAFAGERAVLIQDCTGREDALRYLEAER